MGIRLEKEWMAILDNHTRRVHAALDGRCVYVDKPFDCLLGDALPQNMTYAEWANWKAGRPLKDTTGHDIVLEIRKAKSTEIITTGMVKGLSRLPIMTTDNPKISVWKKQRIRERYHEQWG